MAKLSLYDFEFTSLFFYDVEVLRKLCITVNEATIKAKALELGLWDGTNTIDEQTKARALLNIIMTGFEGVQDNE
jgi:hypothetical protein